MRTRLFGFMIPTLLLVLLVGVPMAWAQAQGLAERTSFWGHKVVIGLPGDGDDETDDEGSLCRLFPDKKYGAGDGPWSVAVGDFDGDGAQDLAVANYESDDVSVLINQLHCVDDDDSAGESDEDGGGRPEIFRGNWNPPGHGAVNLEPRK